MPYHIKNFRGYRRELTRGLRVGGESQPNWCPAATDCAGGGVGGLGESDALRRGVVGEGEYGVRPPCGRMTEAEAAALSVPLVNWSVDTEDWRTKDSGKILDVIYRCTGDGDIVLLHDRYQNTVDAVLMAIEHLQQQGYVFVTVAELLEIKGIAPQAGETYRRAE